MSLRIVIPAAEQFNYDTNEFLETKEQVLQLEHSLVSISKWEAMYHKPFLSQKPKTTAETIDYIRCMTLTQNVDPNVYTAITQDIIDKVTRYINASMTATTFSNERPGSAPRKVITAEVIYYWMIANNIPFECQNWHLDRLLTLINVCNVENGPQKKMSRQEIMRQNHALNEARKAKFKTRG